MLRDVIVVKVPDGEKYRNIRLDEISKETGALVVILPHEVDMLFDGRARDTLLALHKQIHKILEEE